MIDVNHATILIVEDDPGVALLERRRLERAAYAVVTATTAEEALEQLRRHSVDLILLDYRLPGDLDGLDFYTQVRAAGFDPPVILVTGFSSEATVVKALRAGVRDFVTKSTEYLDYLPEAVAQVLRQVRTEHQLVESEARLAALINSAKDAIIIANAQGLISLFNPAAEGMFLFSAHEAIGQPISRFLPFTQTSSGHLGGSLGNVQPEGEGLRSNGEVFPLEISVSPVQVAGQIFNNFVIRDISERRQAELARQGSEMQFRQIWEKSLDGMRLTDQQGIVRLVNAAYCQMVNKTRDELIGQVFTNVYAEQQRDLLMDNFRRHFYARTVDPQRSVDPTPTNELYLWSFPDSQPCCSASSAMSPRKRTWKSSSARRKKWKPLANWQAV
jgi:two-component system cell cycle sensor histidine kinase/response regulator CckA